MKTKKILLIIGGLTLLLWLPVLYLVGVNLESWMWILYILLIIIPIGIYALNNLTKKKIETEFKKQKINKEEAVELVLRKHLFTYADHPVPNPEVETISSNGIKIFCIILKSLYMSNRNLFYWFIDSTNPDSPTEIRRTRPMKYEKIKERAKNLVSDPTEYETTEEETEDELSGRIKKKHTKKPIIKQEKKEEKDL